MSTSLARLRRLYYETKNVFAPSPESPHPEEHTFSEAPHPGTEGVSFEEALEKCPHLARQYKTEGAHCEHVTATDKSKRSRCPYQNGAAQEWPLRAVMMFISYNIISAGVNLMLHHHHREISDPSLYRSVSMSSAWDL